MNNGGGDGVEFDLFTSLQLNLEDNSVLWILSTWGWNQLQSLEALVQMLVVMRSHMALTFMY